MSLRSDRVGQGGGHGTRTGTSFHHGLAWPYRHTGQDEADVLGIHDLGAAFQVYQQVRQGRLQHEERAALMAEDLAAPWLADQVIVVQDATVGVKRSAGKKRKNKMFVSQAHQEGQVTGLGMGGV